MAVFGGRLTLTLTLPGSFIDESLNFVYLHWRSTDGVMAACSATRTPPMFCPCQGFNQQPQQLPVQSILIYLHHIGVSRMFAPGIFCPFALWFNYWFLLYTFLYQIMLLQHNHLPVFTCVCVCLPVCLPVVHCYLLFIYTTRSPSCGKRLHVLFIYSNTFDRNPGQAQVLGTANFVTASLHMQRFDLDI